MDLIYTNAERVDQGVLSTYGFDLSYGASENDFELIVGANEPVLEFGAFAYIEGTEYGGVIDGKKTGTNAETITYCGRTWHGILNSKVIEPIGALPIALIDREDGTAYTVYVSEGQMFLEESGETGADADGNHYTVCGDSNEILAVLIDRLGLGDLFVVADTPGVNINKYKFHRYCKAYDGIADMLHDNNAKLKIAWKNRAVVLSTEPVADYTESPVDGDIATLTVEQHRHNVNHLICLGKGELAEREVIHLYIDQFGRIGDTQFYTGLDEVSDTYNNTNSEDLRSDGIKKMKELQNGDKAEISMAETEVLSFDIGDIVGASEIRSGVSVADTVTQKIVKIKNGVVSTEYKTGG